MGRCLADDVQAGRPGEFGIRQSGGRPALATGGRSDRWHVGAAVAGRSHRETLGTRKRFFSRPPITLQFVVPWNPSSALPDSPLLPVKSTILTSELPCPHHTH